MPLHIRFKMDKIRLMKFFRYMLTEEGYKIINKHLIRATERNGRQVAALARQVIKSSPYARNASLTIALKKSSVPLVNSATLFRSITAKRVSDFEVFVGVLRTHKSYNIAKTLHGSLGSEYAKLIPVTSKMRMMFFLLHKASIDSRFIEDLKGRAKELWTLKPGGWNALNQSTTHIKIPSRPFMEIVVRDPKTIALVKKNWEEGLDKAFREIKRKSK